MLNQFPNTKLITCFLSSYILYIVWGGFPLSDSYPDVSRTYLDVSQGYMMGGTTAASVVLLCKLSGSA